MHETEQHIFSFRGAREGNPIIARAEGIYCYDPDGRRYIDGMGGVGVVSIGHGVTEVFDAAMTQMKSVCFVNPFHWRNVPHMQLTEQIVSMSPAGMSAVFLCSGGSEATETALKMARQYHVERGEPSRYKVISRWSSYHGNTLGALSMSGMTWRRDPFTPLLAPFPHIVPCYCYRCPFGAKYPSCEVRCVHDLEREILRQGPESIAAFIAEPVVGAAAGGATAPPEYFKIVREICDRYGILMIVDEVITGFGRTGKNFGIDHWGVVPDIICAGKGLSGGYTPLGAAIAHERVYEVLRRSPHGFSHGYTYGGNPLSCAIGNAVLGYMRRNGLIENVNALADMFFAEAASLLDLPMVGDIRGKGFWMGVELVSDRETRVPYPAEMGVERRVAEAAFARGLIVGSSRGGIDGAQGNYILLAPPYICTRDDLIEILQILSDAVSHVWESL